MAKFKYVEMVCVLDEKQEDAHLPVAGISAEPLKNIARAMLLEVYLQAFRQGDAQFFALQDEAARQRYFHEELGFPDVLACPASLAYQLDGKIIGFALVLPYLEKNYHISCMCILPEHQGRGLGLAMLNSIKHVARENGCKSLTLGTEPGMKAFQFYQSNGFTVTAEHSVEM